MDARATDEMENREQTVRQTDRWFNRGLIKDVNDQCLTANEGWETVLTDRFRRRHTYSSNTDAHINTHVKCN